MATFVQIKNKKGITYRAQIRRSKGGKIVYSEAKTFDTLTLAKHWAKLRESELDRPGGLDPQPGNGKTLGWLLKAYADRFCGTAARSKVEDIKRLQGYEIADTPLADLRSPALIEHIAWRNQSVKPQTALNDLIWIDIVCKAALPAFGIKVDLGEIAAAKKFCAQHGLTMKSEERDRRPTPDELRQLNEYFESRDGRSDIPMRDIMWFAIHSTRRQAEITKLRRSDNDPAHKTGLVRDIKHPRRKGMNKRFKYTEQAWEIMERQPEGDIIFPYDPKSIGAAFTRACHVLGIKDLRFHDLRREGVSRLFEAGYSIIEVVRFSLHEDWKMLRRYTELRPEDVVLRN